MRIVLLSSLFSLCVAACAASSPRPPSYEVATRRTVQGFAVPESALYDPVTDTYLVSNISGSPFGKDGDGYVSRVAPSGDVVNLRFAGAAGDAASRLNAPKGLALVGRVLFVADLDVIRRFDADSGAPKGVIPVEGAVFLNDLAASPEGVLFATDSALSEGDASQPPSSAAAILRVDDPTGEARVRRIAEGVSLQQPNGIVARAGRVDVVTLGSGEWLTLSPDGAVRTRVKLPGSALDGLIAFEDGSLVASSWETSSLYRLVDGAAPALLVGELPGPADIGYDSKRRIVLVPQLLANELTLLSL